MAPPDKLIARGRWGFRAALSLVVVVLSFYIILSPAYDASIKTWASGMIGIVLGYWLR